MNQSDAEIKRLSQEACAIFRRCSALSEEASRLYNESARLSRQAKASFFGRDKLIADAKRLISQADELMNEQKRLMQEGNQLMQQVEKIKSNANDNEPSENNSIESEQMPAVRQEKQTDLYRFGIDTIIGGTVQFAAPFYLLSKRVLDQTTFNGSLQNYSVDSCKLDIDLFLSKFSIFTEGFVQIISERFAETIRRNTLLPEIRGKTTVSLAKQIREESFGNIDLALGHFALIAADLGITLAHTSTTRSAVSGALVGGGLDFLLTDGDDSIIGTLAGAFLGGALAESNKRNLLQRWIIQLSRV